MATLETVQLQTAREQLLSRRERLENVLEEHPTEQLSQLLSQVDEALQRIDKGQFGLCEVCHETVEADRLMRDPLISVCLGCLSPRSSALWSTTWNWRHEFRTGYCLRPILRFPDGKWPIIIVPPE